jgi:hypothetical protein
MLLQSDSHRIMGVLPIWIFAFNFFKQIINENYIINKKVLNILLFKIFISNF